MTAIELLGLIVAALLLQLTAGIGVSLMRRRASAAMAATASRFEKVAASEGAWAGWRAFRVVQRTFEDAAKSQCSFHLQPVDGQPLPAFSPGQFLTFTLDVQPLAAQSTAEPRTITRCYSLSERPDPSHYRVTIKRVPAPADHPEFAPGLSSNHFHDQVQVGDILRVKAPGGRFFIDRDPGVPVVLIGGGIGITPMMSMLSGAWPNSRSARCTFTTGCATATSTPSSKTSSRWPSPTHRCACISPTAGQATPMLKVATTSIAAMLMLNCCGAPCRSVATSSMSAGHLP